MLVRDADMATPAIVVKVSGSLFDLPDLGPRLQSWLDELKTPDILLVPGGGITANAVRQLDRWQGLGEEHSHWLALRAMTLNAWFLAALFPNGAVIEQLLEYRQAVAAGKMPILDAFAFSQADETRPSHLPHSWAVTSDSLAARVAILAKVPRLVLLKSVPLPPGIDWGEAAQGGLVDDYFPEVVRESPALQVRWQDFRAFVQTQASD
jgi:aspartokinase-like uncharacterized kinase